MTTSQETALKRPKMLVGIVAATVVIFSTVIGLFLLSPSKTFDFKLNQKISPSSSLRLVFPEEMNHSSVEEMLSVPQTPSFAASWDGETYLLTPSEKLQYGQVIVITLDGRAKNSAGEPLGRDLQFTFTVTGAPAVSARIPAPDALDVDTGNEIVIVFDRPVVPLSSVQGEGGSVRPPLPITLKPETRGKWRWLGTTTLAFEPDHDLLLATKYTVSIPAGIQMLSGDKTEQPFDWSFETLRPKIVSVSPEGPLTGGPTSEITVQLNQPVDLISAKDSVHLFRVDGGTFVPLAISLVRYGTKKDEDGVERTDKTSVVAVPKERLSGGTEYSVKVVRGIRGLEGALGSTDDRDISFTTVGQFEVKRADYSDGGIRIMFTSPFNDMKLEDLLTFTPPVDFDKDTTVSAYRSHENGDDSFRSSIWVPLSPSTEYSIEMKKTATDQYGQKLVQHEPFRFVTPALPPSVFVYPQWKSYSVFEKGKPPVFYVNHLNVKKVDVEFGSLPLDHFLAMRKEYNMNYGNGKLDIQNIAEDYQKISFDSTAKVNEWLAKTVDLEKSFGALHPGLYVIRVSSPQWVNTYDNDPLYEDRIFSVTNLGVTLKYSGSKATVWVTDLQTGDPVSNATVRFRTLAGSVPVSGKTNAKGLFEGDLPLDSFVSSSYDWQPEFWVTVEKGDDMAFIGSDWSEGIQPYNFTQVRFADFRGPQTPPHILQSFVYTDRPLYRTGDTVNFKALVRFLEKDGSLIIPDTARSTSVTITDPNGATVFSERLPLSAFGTVNGTFPVADAAALGSYSIQVSVIPDTDIGGTGWANFSVLAYRKPEYKGDVSMDKEEYFDGETAKAKISGSYYFGAPMSDASVVWRAVSTDYFYNKYDAEWYSFSLNGMWCYDECQPEQSVISSGKGKLDAAGRMNEQIPLSLSTKEVSQIVTLEADLTDQNNQVVSTRSSFIAHKSALYVGIRSDAYSVAAGSDAPVGVIVLNAEGNPVAAKKVAVSVYKRHWNTVREKGVDGEYYYSNEPEDTFLKSYDVTSDENGKGRLSVRLPDGGEYRVVAAVTDDSGRQMKAGWSLYAWADTYFNWARTNNDQMEIVTDKPSYAVGETAKLIVKSPYQGKAVRALVTVEREEVMETKIVDVTSNAMSIEVPITEQLVPTAYVSVVVMKPRVGETFNENGVDTGAPAMKIGYARLVISPETKRVTVEVQTDKQKYLPGETVNVTLKTTDHSGKPVPSEVSLAAVDLSLLDLAGFRVPDPLQQFYGERGLGVQTSSMLLFLMERFKPGSKGGGGDGDAEKTRGNFKDTAYWNPSVITDANGKASLSFTLPDNLTTWQLLAIAGTKSNLFGAKAMTVVETKQVIVRPVRPRFAVVGDKLKLGAIVHNYLDQEQEFTVSLDAKGASVDLSSKKLRVPAGGSVKVLFDAVVGDVRELSLHFTAQTGGAKDDVIEKIPVYEFGVLQADATSGVTEDQVEESVYLPSKKEVPEGTISVTVAPSLAAYLPAGLEYLSEFPYGCTEQLLSSFLPSVALSKLKSLNLPENISSVTLRDRVVTALQRLYRNQRPDGGFGYFENSLRSYPYLTAYVLEAFSIAKDAGYAVDRGVTDSALSYLRAEVAGRGASGQLSPASRAYVFFVLSEYGYPDQAALSSLLKNKEDLPLSATVYAAMAYDNAGNTAKASALLSEAMDTARFEKRSVHFEQDRDAASYESMSSDAVITALVLKAATRIDPGHPLIPKIIQGMLDARHDGRWDTTQSTARVLLAFADYLTASKELDATYDAAVSIGGESLFSGRLGKQNLSTKTVEKNIDAFPGSKEVPIKIGKSGQGKLYYDAVFSYFYTPETIEPTEQGIGIQRSSKPLTDDDKQLKVGSVRKVTLTITVPETRHFVAVESMLPAGFEPIDSQYATIQQTVPGTQLNGQGNWYDYYRNQVWRFGHIEFRDDRIFLFAEELPAGVYKYEYLVRATLSGTFRERPARAWEMYAPETFGQTSGGWLKIEQ